MQIQTEEIHFSTKGRTDIIDITDEMNALLKQTGLREGQATVFAIGSTAAITIVEFEPGLVKTDLPQLFERLAPYSADYAHHNTWGDDNGAAHLRASLVGGSYNVPFADSAFLLGTWQQIIFIDFDTRPRSRRVVVQFLGV